jgi:hypothetical protein
VGRARAFYLKMTIEITIGSKVNPYFPLKGLPKYSQIGIFVFANVPSGNPEGHS